ncbi:hypothetical protein [Citrobacter sp. Igbk 16]|uniref:hypothetical protein n=1 Tax=Citrobacter sp. Igbk 16 TaxID=2963958 RepID=UPI002302527E|nr:hypothetical protein [Citrobacter sp. Igbk 16]MDA8518962.1 hypothetical protein [Citrobacter sp. Igbk 16]
MARNKKIIVEVDGDTTGLQKKLNQAESSIGQFGKKVGGEMGSVAENISGGIGRLSGGLTGLVGIAGIAATSFTGLALTLNQNVKELNQLAMQSGLSVTAIQQLDKAFRQTGLGMEKLLDIEQDVKDKMGEGFATGGGEFATTVKELGGNLEEYTKFLNQPNGGIQATLHLIDTMKAAGKTNDEMIFGLEAIASDSSRLLTTYNQLGSSQAVLNHISQQTVTVTEETSAAFLQFDKNLDSMTTTGQSFLYDFMTPVIQEFNDLYALLNKDWTGTEFMNMLYRGADNFLLGGKGVIPDTLKSLMGKDSLDSAYISGSVENDFVNASKAGYVANSGQFQKGNSRSAPTRTGWVDPNAAQKEAEKALKAQEAAARKAQAAAEKAARERETAQRNWETAISNISDNANELRLQNFDRQQAVLQKSIQDTGTILKKSQAEIDEMLARAKESAAAAREEMVNGMIGYTNQNQDLIDQNNLSGLSGEQSSFLADQQNQRINGDNPFAYNNTEKLLEENAQREQLELQLNEKLLAGTEDYERRKGDIKARYAAQALQIEQQNAQQQLSIMGQAAGDMGTMLAGVFGESSTAAKAAWAVQKGISMAQIMMNLQVALSQALATSFPASLAAYAQVASMGAQIITTAGQFHGGVDSLDPSMNNKSFVLKAGERVVQPEANKKLTQFLDDNTGINGGSGETVINAPLIVQGNIDGDDKKFNEMLKKHAQSVNMAVISAQKRST